MRGQACMQMTMTTLKRCGAVRCLGNSVISIMRPPSNETKRNGTTFVCCKNLFI